MIPLNPVDAMIDHGAIVFALFEPVQLAPVQLRLDALLPRLDVAHLRLEPLNMSGQRAQFFAAVAVALGVQVGLGVSVAVGSAVAVSVGVGVTVKVGVLEGAGVWVAVLVGVGLIQN